LLLFGAICFASLLDAQSPGYLGRKFSLGYDLFISPSLYNPNNHGNASLPFRQPMDTNLDKFLLSYNGAHQFSAGYVITRRTSVEAAYFFYRTKAYRKSSSYSTAGNPVIFPAQLVPLTGRGYSLGIKFFSPSGIAPFGNYIKMEFRYQDVLADYRKVKFYDGSGSFFESTGNATEITHSASFGLSFGKQRVLFNRLIADCGIRFCTPFTFNKERFKVHVYDGLEKYMHALTLHRVNDLDFFGFYLGLSPLIF
jgi:hypothetical protein